MTPLRRWWRRTLERWLGRYHEGVEVPERITGHVDAFAALHPDATREELLDFARDLARLAYREGYRRGYEHVERDPSTWLPAVPPEAVADHLTPGWRESESVDLQRGMMGAEVVHGTRADY